MFIGLKIKKLERSIKNLFIKMENKNTKKLKQAGSKSCNKELRQKRSFMLAQISLQRRAWILPSVNRNY